MAVVRCAIVGGDHTFLEVDSTLKGVDGAGEFHQHTITGDLENTSSVFGEKRLQHTFATCLQGCQCGSLVLLHQPTITNHIGRQDGGKAALGAFFSHPVGCSRSMERCNQLYACPRESVYRDGCP